MPILTGHFVLSLGHAEASAPTLTVKLACSLYSIIFDAMNINTALQSRLSGEVHQVGKSLISDGINILFFWIYDGINLININSRNSQEDNK